MESTYKELISIDLPNLRKIINEIKDSKISREEAENLKNTIKDKYTFTEDTYKKEALNDLELIKLIKEKGIALTKEKVKLITGNLDNWSADEIKEQFSTLKKYLKDARCPDDFKTFTGNIEKFLGALEKKIEGNNKSKIGIVRFKPIC